MRDVYRSPVGIYQVHESGWEQLPSGVFVPRLPLMEAAPTKVPDRPGLEQWKGSEVLLAARCTNVDAETWAKVRGWRLATVDEIIESFTCPRNFHIEPTVFPSSSPTFEREAGHTQESEQAWREREMQSLRACIAHDAMCWDLLLALGWDGVSPVDGFGKILTNPHDIVGWPSSHAQRWGAEPGSKYVQPPHVEIVNGKKRLAGSRFHDASYFDYATVRKLACDTNPIEALALATGQLAATGGEAA